MSKKKKKHNKQTGKVQNGNYAGKSKNKMTLPIIIASAVAVAIVAAAIVFVALGSGNSSHSDVESTADETSKAESSSSSDDSDTSSGSDEKVSGKYDLESLQMPSSDSDDKAAGIWQITSGTGSQYESFYYLFDGDEMSALIIGSTGYLSKYAYETDDSGNKVISIEFVFGLNGSYTYEFSGNDTMILTNTDSNEESVLTKSDSASFVPNGSEGAQIDENLVGCWSSGTGEYLCFDTNGVMYQNLFENMFAYSTYTAANGELESTTYSSSDKTSTDNYTYSVDGDTLTLDDSTYTRISFDELK